MEGLREDDQRPLYIGMSSDRCSSYFDQAWALISCLLQGQMFRLHIILECKTRTVRKTTPHLGDIRSKIEQQGGNKRLTIHRSRPQHTTDHD